MEKLFDSILESSLSLKITIFVILAAFVLGFIITLVYMLTNKNNYSQSFLISMIILPIVISTIVLLVENSIARAFSLAGAFALIRFRSAPGNPRDISYIFLALSIGLACGIGYIGYAAVITLIVCIILLILHFSRFGHSTADNLTLKISIPEDLDYQNTFNEVFSEFTTFNKIKRVKTSDFGAIFIIEYTIKLKKNADQKKFIDNIRCLNGNLNISLLTSESSDSFAV